MRPTVFDIAASAGVSLATVDRVLNNRPGVRAKTRERVEKAISDIGYVRDVAAANLAKSRQYKFIFLVPDNDNSFMIALSDAVEQMADALRVERVNAVLKQVPAFDAGALAAEIRSAVCDEPDGIAIVAVDDDGVRTAVAEADAAGIPVVTLVSDLPGSARIHFAGIDNIAAGRTAASLLGRFMKGEAGTVAVIAGSLVVRDHRERLAGFQAVMREAFPGFRVLPVIEGRDDPALVERLAGDLIAETADLQGIYSLGGGNRGLLRALKTKDGRHHLPVIVHELTRNSRDGLNSGLFDAVLNQDAGHEVRSAIRVMKAHADGLAKVDAQERIRIDIFIKDNLP